VQLPKHQQGEPEQLLPGFDGDWDEGAEDDGEPTGVCVCEGVRAGWHPLERWYPSVLILLTVIASLV
jgi:hypothetical protein